MAFREVVVAAVAAVAALSLLAVAADALALRGCEVHVNGDLPNPQPVILRGDSVQPEFLYPDADDAINLSMGQTVRMLCLGKGNTFKYKKTSEAIQEIVATCVQGDSFSVDGIHYNFSSLACKEHAWNEAVRSGTCLDGRYTSIDVGFQISASEFLTTMQLCFDEDNYDPVYSKYTLKPSIKGYQSQFPRPSFSPGKFYGKVDVNGAYKRKNQKLTVGNTLGSNGLGQQYVHDKDDYFLARGHLTAKADFVYGVEHRATFYYMNTAPQWQTFNGGNWLKLEESVRDFVAQKKITAEVTTGIWGISTLPDVTGRETPLYLYVDNNGNRAVKVPKYYWKAVYEPETRRGVVFVGMNNPYHKTTAEDVFCKDICLSDYEWINWKRDDQEAGYSFCCAVDDFRRTVDTLPPFEVEGLL